MLKKKNLRIRKWQIVNQISSLPKMKGQFSIKFHGKLLWDMYIYNIKGLKVWDIYLGSILISCK